MNFTIGTISDSDTEAAEAMIAEIGALFMRGRKPTENPVALLVHVYREVAESWPKRDKEAALAGALRPTSRPDGDNHLKLVSDALNGICWRDDSQVVDARIIKLFDPKPALRIEIREFLPPSVSGGAHELRR